MNEKRLAELIAVSRYRALAPKELQELINEVKVLTGKVASKDQALRRLSDTHRNMTLRAKTAETACRKLQVQLEAVPKEPLCES